MSIWGGLSKAAGYLVEAAVNIAQDLMMDPLSGSMKAELIILARKSQGKPAPRGNGSSRAALRRRGLVEPYGDSLTERGWNWYNSFEANGDVDDFLAANDIHPGEGCREEQGAEDDEWLESVFRRDDEKKKSTKVSRAKTIQQKSYYKWLYGCLLKLKEFDAAQGVCPAGCSAWTMIVEEELLALEVHMPLLDVDDIRALSRLALVREELIEGFLASAPRSAEFEFNFDQELVSMPGNRKAGLRAPGKFGYPVLDEASSIGFRALCSERIRIELLSRLPSLCSKQD